MQRVLPWVVAGVLVVVLIVICAVMGTRITHVPIHHGMEIMRNPYSDTGVLLWPVAIMGHWPVEMGVDFPIKEDIVRYARTLTGPHAIVDCGAHVGDGSLPIAAALADVGRDDIVVYAVEPDPHKCAIIRLLVHLNNVTNLRIICTGLSDVDGQYVEADIPSDNSGGTTWRKTETGGVPFQRLDALYADGKITQPLGCVHLDVEGMELPAIRGAQGVIQKYKPYMSVEDQFDSRPAFLGVLPGYHFHQRLNQNNVYLPDLRST